MGEVQILWTPRSMEKSRAVRQVRPHRVMLSTAPEYYPI
jgi:hypothetical protein